MAASTWRELTRGLDADDLAKLAAFRDFCRSLPGVSERSFTSAYVKSHYLELGVELRRTVDSLAPRTSFATAWTVVMHRCSLRRPEDFDDRIRDLIREAADTVGPGTRR